MPCTVNIKYPDRCFVDDLGEWDSFKPKDNLSWIDELEMLDAILGD